MGIVVCNNVMGTINDAGIGTCLAVRLINKTGVPSVKGYCVTADPTTDFAVSLVPINVPNCIGVFYESGVLDGQYAWVITYGLAYVYFSTAVVHGYLARTPLGADAGGVSGQAISEAVPTSPFTNDKHFCEIGHCLESRGTPGLALVNLHFN